MYKLLFCNKCGKVGTTELEEAGSKCWTCKEGIYVDAGVDYSKANSEVSKEYKEKHPGDYPSVEESNEMLREKYFYGKLDYEISESARSTRKYKESPEGIEEHNRVVDQWYLKQNTMNSSNVPKCPTCNSTDIRKISTGERVVSVGILGLFSKKINKSFKCNKCGYTW